MHWSHCDRVQRLLFRIASSKYNRLRARTCPIPRMVHEGMQDGHGTANPRCKRPRCGDDRPGRHRLRRYSKNGGREYRIAGGHGWREDRRHRYGAGLRPKRFSERQGVTDHDDQGHHVGTRRLRLAGAVRGGMHGGDDGQGRASSAGTGKQAPGRACLDRRSGQKHHRRPEIHHRAARTIYRRLKYYTKGSRF